MPHKYRYRIAAYCILFFLAAQTFQELASWFWIPRGGGPEQALLNTLLPIDRAGALLVLASIASLIVPYIIIARRYRSIAPAAATLGLIGGVAFIGLELVARSLDLFVVGDVWARALQAGGDREAILNHYALWGSIMRGLSFPMMASHLGLSVAFAYATRRQGDRWSRNASLAFSLNAVRLLGGMAGTFAGVAWLDALNTTAYYPLVLIVNVMLARWLFHLAERASGRSHRSPTPSPPATVAS